MQWKTNSDAQTKTGQEMPHAELSAYAASNQSPTKPMRGHSRPKPTKQESRPNGRLSKCT